MECRDPRDNGAGERVTVPLTLLSAGDEDLSAAFDHVMEDLADALGVYERMAAPRAGSHRGREETRRARSFSLFKIEVEAGIGVEHAAREAMGPCSLSGLPLYACAIAAGSSAQPAVDALVELETSCRKLKLPWGGGVALCGGALIAPCAEGPRMGRMRRARSEAVDLLIAAIRSGCPVSDLMGGPASGILVARCPVPAPLYPLVVRLHGNGGTRPRA